MSATSTIVDRIWNYCNVLRDDGVSYGDYLEQLTYLLFLKMDHENVTELGKPSAIPAEYNWNSVRRPGRRRTGKPLPPNFDRAGAGQRPHPRHLPQSAKQNPGPGQAAAAHPAD